MASKKAKSNPVFKSAEEYFNHYQSCDSKSNASGSKYYQLGANIAKAATAQALTKNKDLTSLQGKG